MKTMKHLCILLFTCLSFWSITALATGTPIKEIVFFGDSLSDNGNLYAHDFHKFPPSPPYYHGRFSDGRTWAENLADHYYDIYYTRVQNYATGGATTFLHNPFDGFLPLTVGEEIDDYIIRDLGTDKGHTLFVIWSGGNDYLPGSQQVDKDTSHVVQQYISDIDKLVSNGAKNILVLNLPDLGGTPRAISNNSVKNLHDLTVMHNRKLAKALAIYTKQHTEIDLHTFDVFSLFKQIINNTAEFNKQHNTHFSNVNTACWEGGSLLQATNNINQMTQLLAPNDKQLALTISHSPELMEAYQVGESVKQGAHPCSDPTNYIFWDHIHPTSEVHRSLASIVVQMVDKNYTFQHNAS